MPRSITRRDLEQRISDLARAAGWRHHRASRQGVTPAGYADGFPADVLLRDGTLIFVSISSGVGRLARAESDWLEALRRVDRVESLSIEVNDLPMFAQALLTGELTRLAAINVLRSPTLQAVRRSGR